MAKPRTQHGRLQDDVFGVVTQLAPCTVRDVHKHFMQSRPVAYNTIHTVMGRLVTQGVLAREMQAGVGVYSIARSDSATDASNLADRLVHRYGTLGVAEFVARAKTDPALLKVLRDLLDEEVDDA